MDLGTPFGLAFASGINAYLPMLSFAIAVRFLHLYKVNPNFAFITSNWCIAALVLLTIIDFVADKLPVIDHAWDAIHTVVRPIAGALIAAASYGRVTIDTHATGSSSLFPIMHSTINSSHLPGTVLATNSTPLALVGLVIMLLLGAVLAATSHTAKATTRLVSTATTAGFFNIVLSIIEDVLVIILVLLSLLVPIVMLILIGLFLIIFGPRLLRIWRKWRGRHEFIK